MKKRKLMLFIMLNLLLVGVHAQADGDSVAFNRMIAMMKHIKVFQMTYPQEKVYMHFDNTGYFKGERMYFKAYVTRTDRGLPTDISKVLYVDLLNPSGDVIHKSKLRLEKGEAHGDIAIDSIIGTGFYEVRAYTRYMLNFGDETCFSRVIPIFNKPEKNGDYSNPVIDHLAYYQRLPERELPDDSIATLTPVEQKRKKGGGYQVNVYPEGGKMVKGLMSRVAFTVLDKNHLPVALMGEVVDADGNTLNIVASGKDGRGIFDLVPTTEKMTMILTTPDKKKLEFDMPEALSSGVVLNVDAVQDNVVGAKLMATDDMKGRLMAYTLMNNGNIYVTDTLLLADTQVRLFRRDKLKPGVNQLTFFDADGHIHAERLFFICPPLTAADSITVEKVPTHFTPCGTVKLNLHSAPNARYSFSAMDAQALVNGKYGNINTYMLLGSEVRGFIPHPEYYFQADDQTHRLAADSLMLFNGWRRYDWQVMADVTPWRGKRMQQVEDQLYVYGHIKPSLSKWKKKHPIDGVDMTMYIFKDDDGRYLMGETTTDSTGFYAFRIPDIEGKWHMQILTKIEDKLKTFEVMVDRQFNPQSRYITADEAKMLDYPDNIVHFDADIQAFEGLDNQRAVMQRTGNNEYATSAAKIRAKTNWRYTKSNWWDDYNGRLHANLFYDCAQLTQDYADKGEQQPGIYEWLIEHNTSMEGLVKLDYVDETPVLKGTANYNSRNIIWMVDNHVMGITGLITDNHGNPTAPSTQLLHLMSTSGMYDEEMIIMPTFMDEVKSCYIWSDQESTTYAVVVYLYTYPYVSTASKKGRRRTYFRGFDVPTKFKTDDYSVIPPQPDDYRRTLYWNPEIQADANGNAAVEFYNNSTCQWMYFSAEGITPDGKFITTK